MDERRNRKRHNARNMEAIVLGRTHTIRDLDGDTVFIEGEWLTCATGHSIYFWIKPVANDDVSVTIANGTVIRHEPGVGAAVMFETEYRV